MSATPFLNFSLIEMTSFWSIWYWVITVVAWSMTSHWTLGVPHDIVMLARKYGGAIEDNCTTLAHINAQRLIYYFDKGGVYLLGIMTFILASIATVGFYGGVEFAQALFMLLAPLSIPMGLTVRLAYLVEREQLAGEALLQVLRRQRLWNQIIGFVAITITMVVAVTHFLMT